MKIVKILAGIVLVLIVLAGVGVVLLYKNLGGIVKAGIEHYGPKFTGTAVTVDSVDLDPKTGMGAIHGLFIGNPDGYSTDFAVSCETISITIDVRSLNKEKIIIRDITIKEPKINYEAVLPTGSNLMDIKNFVNSATPAGSTDATAAEDAPVGESKRYQIDKLTLTGGTVLVSHKGVGGNGIPVTLPEINETDIGSGPEGVTMKEAVTRITNSLFASIKDVAVRNVEGIGDLGDKVKATGSGVVDGLKGLLPGQKSED